ncbi:hypothetical protein D3C78_1851530 [compost metagenome]
MKPLSWRSVRCSTTLRWMIRYQLNSEASSNVSMTALTNRLASLIRPQIVMCSRVACMVETPVWRLFDEMFVTG